jgi:hypothetical protein
VLRSLQLLGLVALVAVLVTLAIQGYLISAVAILVLLVVCEVAWKWVQRQ